MLENYVRTDLALELKEDISEKNDIAGVRVETYEDSEYGLTKTHIRVLDQTGAEIRKTDRKLYNFGEFKALFGG